MVLSPEQVLAAIALIEDQADHLPCDGDVLKARNFSCVSVSYWHPSGCQFSMASALAHTLCNREEGKNGALPDGFTAFRYDILPRLYDHEIEKIDQDMDYKEMSHRAALAVLHHIHKCLIERKGYLECLTANSGKPFWL